LARYLAKAAEVPASDRLMIWAYENCSYYQAARKETLI